MSCDVDNAYAHLGVLTRRLQSLGEPEDEIRSRFDELLADQGAADREPEPPPAPDPDSLHERNR